MFFLRWLRALTETIHVHACGSLNVYWAVCCVFCALTRVHIQTVRCVLSVRGEALHGQLQLLLLPAPQLPLLVGADQGFHGKRVGSRAQSGGRSPPLTHFSQIHASAGGERRKTHSVRPTANKPQSAHDRREFTAGIELAECPNKAKVIQSLTRSAAAESASRPVPSCASRRVAGSMPCAPLRVSPSFFLL